MTLIVETGAGIAGAESYATVAYITAYWAARPHLALAATWAAAIEARQEGAAREATAFCDATWGVYYRGIRAGYVQGLLFPRTGAKDDAGYLMPALPTELKVAVAELAARALSAPLATDVDRGGEIKRIKKKVGPLEKETEYFDTATVEKSFGSVAGILAPLMNGSQPGGYGAATWHWN